MYTVTGIGTGGALLISRLRYTRWGVLYCNVREVSGVTSSESMHYVNSRNRTKDA